MSTSTITRYEQACRDQCEWCAKGDPLITWNHQSGKYHQTSQGSVCAETCTAPAIEVWAEQQAKRLAEAEALIKALTLQNEGQAALISITNAEVRLTKEVLDARERAEKAEALNLELVEALRWAESTISLIYHRSPFTPPWRDIGGADFYHDTNRLISKMRAALASTDAAKEKPCGL